MIIKPRCNMFNLWLHWFSLFCLSVQCCRKLFTSNVCPYQEKQEKTFLKKIYSSLCLLYQINISATEGPWGFFLVKVEVLSRANFTMANFKETSQKLRMLSRSLSDCKSLLFDVMIQVSQFVSNCQLCH